MIFGKLKLTPLSFIIALCITYAFALLAGLIVVEHTGVSSVTKAIFTLVLALVLFLTDLIFRKFIFNLKWLWLTELAFAILIVSMILIFQKF